MESIILNANLQINLMKINKRFLEISIFLSIISLVWFSSDSCRKDRCKIMNKEMITLVPIGSIDKRLITTLANSLEEVFGIPISVFIPLPLPYNAYNKSRRQYHATRILDKVRGKASYCKGRMLGIVNVDLYVPELNFVFGEADLLGNAAIITLPRLRQEFYGLPGDESLFLKRTLKEAVHELGHTFGLRHCGNETCVMHFSNTLMDTDRKQATFCPVCCKKLP